MSILPHFQRVFARVCASTVQIDVDGDEEFEQGIAKDLEAFIGPWGDVLRGRGCESLESEFGMEQ